MKKTKLPETTLALLSAVVKCGEISRVCIRPQHVEFFPAKTRCTGDRIREAGISDILQRFVTHSLSASVAHHFRIGSYDISGSEIKILR